MDIVYIIGHETFALPEEWKTKAKIVLVPVPDWNRDLSPWPAERVFKGEDFSGGADAFLQHLLSRVIPEVEKKDVYERRFLLGYSLAGLFSLYAATKTNLFHGVGSCSGSLWFDGFLSYLEEHPVAASRVYLSLGNKEKNSRNERMKRVESCTLSVLENLKEQDIETTFVLEEGGHFQEPDARVLRGLVWLLSS